ncbi:MAG TPA: hypothetical protein VE172_20015, partial [Stackebrandtia sp.]
AVEALRAAFRDVLAGMSAADLDARRERQVFVVTVPQLWTAHLPGVAKLAELLNRLVAKRMGRAETDDRVRATAGAVLGVLLSVWLEWADDPGLDAASTLDARLALF